MCVVCDALLVLFVLGVGYVVSISTHIYEVCKHSVSCFPYFSAGVCNFKISGRLQHLIDQHLEVESRAEPKHAQHFIIDGDHMACPSGFEKYVDEGLLNELLAMLKEHNHYARELRRVSEVAAESGNPTRDYQVCCIVITPLSSIKGQCHACVKFGCVLKV